MKRLMLSAVALFVFVAAANAQVKVGPVAGLNISNVSGDDIEGADSRIGFHVGGVADIMFGNFSFQPGLLFTTKGNTFEFEFVDFTSGQSFSIENDVALSYLEIPLNVAYNIEIGDGSYIQPMVGPYIGIPLSGTVTSTVDGEETEEDLEDLSADIGVTLGANAIISGVLVGAGYQLGFTEIADGADATNNNLYIRVGYLFGGE